MDSLPHGIYYAIGFFALTNLSLLGGVGRIVWYVAKADARLEKVERDLDFLFEKHRSERTDTPRS